MLQLCLTLLFLGTLIQAEPYQPGTPGRLQMNSLLEKNFQNLLETWKLLKNASNIYF